MSKAWTRDYRGYGIVSTSTKLGDRRYTASFSAMEEERDGNVRVIELQHLDGEFSTDDDAHVAGLAEGRRYIDSLFTKY
jgi:hypothetical protein